MKRLLFTCLLGLSLIGCNKQQTKAVGEEGQIARGFSLQTYDAYTLATIYNPFNPEDVQGRYCLMTSDSIALPDSIRNTYTRVRVPIDKIATTSCTHIGFLEALDALDCLVGVSDPSLIYSQTVRHELAEGKIADLGSALQLNAEQLIAAQAQVILMSSYSADDPNIALMKKLGIPVIYENEWTESDPLGRAEWIRLIGAFVGKQAMADSIFERLRTDYQALADSIRQTIKPEERRSVISGGDYRGTWYVPAGGTYMGKLFRDAGVAYYYENDPGTASIPLQMEAVIQNMGNADIWLGAPATSLHQLAEISEKHTWFDAYQHHQVYNFDARTTASGGNDFWESGVVHPELILRDIHQAAYRADNQRFTYIHHLQD